MENTKITLAQRFEVLASMVDFTFEDGVTAKDFLLERAEKSANRKPSKADERKKAENEAIKGRLVEALSEGACSVSNLVKRESLADLGLSVPKASAMLTQLLAEGKVTRAIEKKTPIYSV